ncbi:MAG: dethiobiotin synthase [Gammaproteobacteria bacterium]|nr:dethiobiotin synthase [Gammaproteobacteria bacterium]
MNKTIFVTGTDTGVGKTLISKTLINYFVSQGEVVAPMKPVASGAEIAEAGHNGMLVNDDALTLIEAANTQLNYSEVNPYVFREPIAPHIAAKKNSIIIDINELNLCYQHLKNKSDRVIIEGAGGWQVPLNDASSMADWVSQNKWPVILVIGLRLGCINHARLSYLDIMAKQNPLAGWIVNTIDPDVLESDAVIADLARFIKAPMLGVIPWLGVEYQSGADIMQYLDLSMIQR